MVQSPPSASQAFLYSYVWLSNATLKEKPMIDASLPPFSRMDASIMENSFHKSSFHIATHNSSPSLCCFGVRSWDWFMLVQNHQISFWYISGIEAQSICFHFKLRVLALSEFWACVMRYWFLFHHVNHTPINFWTLGKLFSSLAKYPLFYKKRQCYLVLYIAQFQQKQQNKVSPLVSCFSWSKIANRAYLFLTYQGSHQNYPPCLSITTFPS